MDNDTKTRRELRASFGRFADASAQAGAPLSMNHPVKLPHLDQVPVTGSVHLSTGRTVSRETIEKRFAKAK
jgi:hypothetical protein